MRRANMILTGVVILLGTFLLGTIVGHQRLSSANNEYQLYIYPTKAILADKNRLIGQVPFPTHTSLDSLILSDNQ